MISIHAPAKGATGHRCGAEIHQEFQSTLPRRERRALRKRGVNPFRFQSTLPRRERHTGLLQKILDLLFQSTLPRRERPCRCFDLQPCHTISIHAPAKGATICGCASDNSLGYFNPRSREGSDPIQIFTNPESSNFNPRSREGSDEVSQFLFCKVVNFNPRSREGSDVLKFLSK